MRRAGIFAQVQTRLGKSYQAESELHVSHVLDAGWVCWTIRDSPGLPPVQIRLSPSEIPGVPGATEVPGTHL